MSYMRERLSEIDERQNHLWHSGETLLARELRQANLWPENPLESDQFLLLGHQSGKKDRVGGVYHLKARSLDVGVLQLLDEPQIHFYGAEKEFEKAPEGFTQLGKRNLATDLVHTCYLVKEKDWRKNTPRHLEELPFTAFYKNGRYSIHVNLSNEFPTVFRDLGREELTQLTR